MFTRLELQYDKFNYTYGDRERERESKHDAVAALVTRF